MAARRFSWSLVGHLSVCLLALSLVVGCAGSALGPDGSADRGSAGREMAARLTTASTPSALATAQGIADGVLAYLRR